MLWTKVHMMDKQKVPVYVGYEGCENLHEHRRDWGNTKHFIHLPHQIQLAPSVQKDIF